MLYCACACSIFKTQTCENTLIRNIAQGYVTYAAHSGSASYAPQGTHNIVRCRIFQIVTCMPGNGALECVVGLQCQSNFDFSVGESQMSMIGIWQRVIATSTQRGTMVQRPVCYCQCGIPRTVVDSPVSRNTMVLIFISGGSLHPGESRTTWPVVDAFAHLCRVAMVVPVVWLKLAKHHRMRRVCESDRLRGKVLRSLMCSENVRIASRELVE